MSWVKEEVHCFHIGYKLSESDIPDNLKQRRKKYYEISRVLDSLEPLCIVKPDEDIPQEVLDDIPEGFIDSIKDIFYNLRNESINLSLTNNCGLRNGAIYKVPLRNIFYIQQCFAIKIRDNLLLDVEGDYVKLDFEAADPSMDTKVA